MGVLETRCAERVFFRCHYAGPFAAREEQLYNVNNLPGRLTLYSPPSRGLCRRMKKPGKFCFYFCEIRCVIVADGFPFAKLLLRARDQSELARYIGCPI